MDYKQTEAYKQSRAHKLETHKEANEIKDLAHIYGYVHAISFYGVITHKESHSSEFRRIEVLSNREYDRESLQYLNDFFTIVIPVQIYSIWWYNAEYDDISFKGGWS